MVRTLNRIIVTAGGTGGHVFPALAVARQLREEGVEVLWVGTEAGLESTLVPGAGFNIEYISISGLRGKGVYRWLAIPVRAVRAVMQSIKITNRFSPDVVLGMGGFASGPCGMAAWLKRIPLCIQEQNAVAGLTNRILSKMAKVVMQAFPGTFNQTVKPISTGNPVRDEIINLPSASERYAQRKGNIRLLVVGGSLGAAVLNEKVPQALSAMKANSDLDVWHQTGKNKLQETIDHYRQAGIDAKVNEFIDDMAQAYAWADLVICRSGALTVSELAVAGVAAVLVPYPYAVDDHQTLNANVLLQAGAAVVIQQKDMSVDSLAGLLTQMVSSGRNGLREMAIAADSVAVRDATQRVADACREVVCGN